VTGGVIAHLPMYIMGRSALPARRYADGDADEDRHGRHPRRPGRELYGLIPRNASATAERVTRIRVSALDDASLTAAHYGLLVAMMLAVTIDIMKPTALAFVMPGMTTEYGLKGPLNPSGTIPVAYVSLSGIVGTVLGSFLWGWLGDRIGRRASILYAGIGFIGTSICGAMPTFSWNLVMCFVMGVAVGGMLPICYYLLAETIPARHRSWLMILIGADIAGAYVITSWLASRSCRPTAGASSGSSACRRNPLRPAQPLDPESPRYLLANGRDAEANAVMRRFGAVVVERHDNDLEVESQVRSWKQLLSGELLWLTAIVGVLALGSGLVLFGFNLWIPRTCEARLHRRRRDPAQRRVDRLPAHFVIAWMYGFWSSRRRSSRSRAHRRGAVRLRHRRQRDRAESCAALSLLVIPIWGSAPSSPCSRSTRRRSTRRACARAARGSPPAPARREAWRSSASSPSVSPRRRSRRSR
jgi:putative MFS transporter